MVVIKVENAFKHYKSKSDTKIVLSDFSMNVKRGSIYALMGASGCGKTTIISCITGTNHLDQGVIEVFDDGVGKHNSKLGFMPQELALIDEFTIKESLHFFGTLFGMKASRINERLKFLSELLELPSHDNLVGKCSGGQQRRISFAIALVHEPEILILDEPTVGVDPLLRSRIWDYLIDITRTKNVTVLMTTHYIEEARQSTHVGLMRQGRLLIEDTPQNLLEKCQTSSLEEAFLKLSENENQEKKIEEVNQPFQPAYTSAYQAPRKRKTRNESLRPSNTSKLRALVMKNLIQVVRNPGIIVFSIIMPIIGIFCLHSTVGGNPSSIKLGIVNKEVLSMEECFDPTLTTFQVNDTECELNKISCRFIQLIDESLAIKKYYTSRDDARNDAKRGNLIGYIYFASNFSDSFPVLKYWNEATYNDDGHIQVSLDTTDLQTLTFLQRNLYRLYHVFVEDLMVDCDKSEKVGSTPMVFKTFNGSLYDEFKKSIVPGLLISTFFAIASYLTSMALIDDRHSGIWNRALTAGATPAQFLISHLIVGSAVMALQAIEFIIYAVCVGTNSQLSFVLLVSLLVFSIGFASTLYGLCISVLTDSTLVATYFSILVTYPFLSLSGIFWPLQGAAPFLQYVGYLLPFTLPSRSFMSIMFSDLKFTNPSIYMGFVVIACWIFIEAIICFWFTRSKSVKK